MKYVLFVLHTIIEIVISVAAVVFVFYDLMKIPTAITMLSCFFMFYLPHILMKFVFWKKKNKDNGTSTKFGGRFSFTLRLFAVWLGILQFLIVLNLSTESATVWFQYPAIFYLIALLPFLLFAIFRKKNKEEVSNLGKKPVTSGSLETRN
jgi:hypothetical protein